jgi:hypothetical protein
MNLWLHSWLFSFLAVMLIVGLLAGFGALAYVVLCRICGEDADTNERRQASPKSTEEERAMEPIRKAA